MSDENVKKKALTFNELISILQEAIGKDESVGNQLAYINMGTRSMYMSTEVCGLTKCNDGAIAIQGK